MTISKCLVAKVDVLFQDDHLIAVHKPSGLFTHPSERDRDADSAMRQVRDQLGRWVYPAHRLDRGTSGVLVFALDSETASLLGEAFRERRVKKTYLAIVRGFAPNEILVDHSIRGEGALRAAQTAFRRLAKITLDIPVGRWPTARYSLIQAEPLTGRLHQIRRHCAHLRHPIVGDRVHGDGVHNRIFEKHFRVRRLLLHALRLEFVHPYTGESISIHQKVTEGFRTLCEQFDWAVDQYC